MDSGHECQCQCSKQQPAANAGGGLNLWVQAAVAIIKLAAVVIKTCQS